MDVAAADGGSKLYVQGGTSGIGLGDITVSAVHMYDIDDNDTNTDDNLMKVIRVTVLESTEAKQVDADVDIPDQEVFTMYGTKVDLTKYFVDGLGAGKIASYTVVGDDVVDMDAEDFSAATSILATTIATSTVDSKGMLTLNGVSAEEDDVEITVTRCG